MKRVVVVALMLPVVAVGAVLLSFAVTQTYLVVHDYPIATQAPDWEVLAKEEIPSIVTLDADGSRRVTQLWIAAFGGKAYIRTGDTAWFANLERSPQLDLRIGGTTSPCATRVAHERTEIASVHEAFRAKYPRRSEFFRSIGISTNTVIALTCIGET